MALTDAWLPDQQGLPSDRHTNDKEHSRQCEINSNKINPTLLAPQTHLNMITLSKC